MMRLHKWMLVAAAVVGGTLLSAKGPALAVESAGSTRPAEISKSFDPFDISSIHQKAEACRATAEERKFDRIGWATRILDAEQLAREHNRPVFLFTHDGRISTGRC